MSNESSQKVPHTPFMLTSTLPPKDPLPFTSLTLVMSKLTFPKIKIC